ncbi:MAG: hypothetical protein EP344_06630 [Bacteroidetes bacterium]|nr:MAG: hypothetical protein EP344_06630 [Bacteroidota bacterium]
MLRAFLFLLLSLPLAGRAQTTITVDDQTFKMDGEHIYTYAFAQGDQLTLQMELLVGRKVQNVTFEQFNGPSLFSDYGMDSSLHKTIRIPQTAVYQLRVRESGLGKKVCRFSLHRTPAGPLTERMDTRVTWDVRQYPQYQEQRRMIKTGSKTGITSLGGQVNVSASKLGIKNPVSAYHFSLPPNTVQWAYRITVGQAMQESRKKDADQLTSAINSGAARLLPVAPPTALAAFALGMAIDLTVPKVGEDVEYALLTAENLPLFRKREPYKAFIWQEGVSSDVQRRYSPLEGSYYFAFRSDNWMDDITINVDIEAVTETPIFAEEIFLEPVK